MNVDKKEIQKEVDQLVAKLDDLEPDVRRATQMLILSLKALILNAPDPGEVMIRYTQEKWVELAQLLARKR